MLHPAFSNTHFDVSIPAGGLPAVWYGITAFSRPGTVRALAAEAAAQRALEERLSRDGLAYFPVTGRSPSADHAEPGFGVVTTEVRARELARAFDQAAIFRVEKGELALLDVDEVSAPPYALGRFADRVGLAPEGLASSERFLRFAPACAVKKAALLRFLGDCADRARHFEVMLSDSDESPYTASDWCEAAAHFQNRLEAAGRVSPFATKNGYLHCCAMASESIPAALRPGLTASFTEMWDAYGYEG